MLNLSIRRYKFFGLEQWLSIFFFLHITKKFLPVVAYHQRCNREGGAEPPTFKPYSHCYTYQATFPRISCKQIFLKTLNQIGLYKLLVCSQHLILSKIIVKIKYYVSNVIDVRTTKASFGFILSFNFLKEKGGSASC